MTERLVSKLHVALLSYDEREIRVRKNYLEEQNPAICCVCFHSGEELLRELRQQRSVDIVVLSSQLEDMITTLSHQLYFMVNRLYQIRLVHSTSLVYHTFQPLSFS